MNDIPDNETPSTDNGWRDMEQEWIDRVTIDVDGKTNLNVPLAGDGDDPAFSDWGPFGRKRQHEKKRLQ